MAGQVVPIGYGRVGSHLGKVLLQENILLVVIEHNLKFLEKLRFLNLAAVSGDASEAAVLIPAHIMNASMLVIEIPDGFNVRKTIDIINIDRRSILSNTTFSLTRFSLA